MSFACPRCESRYTQSLPMVYGTGTQTRSWVSRSGYRGNSTSQTLVSSLASPPEKRSVLRPLLWLLVFWMFFGVPMAQTLQSVTAAGASPGRFAPIVEGGRYHPGRTRALRSQPPALPPEAVQTLQIAGGSIGLLLTGLAIWRIVLAVRFNRLRYPGLLRAWQSSFMCRSCGAIFQPSHPQWLA